MATQSKVRQSSTPKRTRSIGEFIKAIISRGETLYTEFTRSTIRPRDFAEKLVGFLNGDGGIILVGVEDDGKITGIDLEPSKREKFEKTVLETCEPRDPSPPVHFIPAKVDGAQLLIAIVQPGRTVYHTRGITFKRELDPKLSKPRNRRLSPQEQSDLVQSRGQVSFEAIFEQRASESDLDDVLIERYISQRAPGQDWRELFYNEGLVELRQRRLIPTNACLLLFGKNPSKYLDRCDIDFARYEGTQAKVGRELNVVKRQHFSGPLPKVIEEAVAFVRGQIRTRSPLTGLVFEEAPEYPELAWQEAIVNAVAHRDYSLKGMPIQVRLFEDRMEVESPGKILPPNTVDGLRSGKYTHNARNPRIVRCLYDFGYMRMLGEGIKRIFQEMERTYLQPPEFSEPNHSVRVVLRNTPVFEPGTQAWIRRFDSYSLNPRQCRGLALIHQKGGITNASYRAVNHGITREQAVADLRKMRELKLLELMGKGRAARYVISAQIEEKLQARLPLTKEEKLVSYLREHGSISRGQYQNLVEVEADTAYLELRRYVQKGLLVRTGKKRGTKYQLAKLQ